jgi:hypothetical protein
MPPTNPNPFNPGPLKPPSPKQQSWGTIISLIIIVLMIVVGALYAWGKRIAEQQAFIEQTSTTTQTY